ncbi:Cell cycle serine/threonine-protein kinase cdc5/MSD2 [Entomortierella beljakovae]|nr:Cell cycle serine/threonine-protein kinase cdc5/MSD2 [Entomortierella beljakovae]
MGSSSLFHNPPYRQQQIANRNDNGVGSSTNTRANMAITQNTQTTMMTTATTTTNQTGMTDKPKTRKKDKPPKIPPPEQIYDINGKSFYTRGPALGEGGFASCYIIVDQGKNRFAAKVIQKSDLPTFKTRQKLFAEIKIHQGLTHENIVKYYHCFEDDDFVYLVLELCESKTLMELIKRRKRLTEPEVRYYMREIVAGCSYLHRTASVIHRDLKLGNIFLTGDMHVRIGDFGLATLIVKDERKKTICGTPNYIAPEILFDTDNGHSFEVDIWSIGVIMYTLLVGKPPFQTTEVKAIYKNIRDNNYVFPDDLQISEDAKNLVSALLTPTPASRPSVENVLSHPFFASGYCPEKLSRTSLHGAPNFEQEENELKLRQGMLNQVVEQEQAPKTTVVAVSKQPKIQAGAQEGADMDTPKQAKGRTQSQQRPQQKQSEQLAPRQQLHYDQTSFGVGPQADEITRRHSEARANPTGQPSGLSAQGGNKVSGQQQYDTPQHSVSRPSPPSKHTQQMSQSAANRLNYGEKVKMEYVEDGLTTSVYRFVNVDRGGGGGRHATQFGQYIENQKASGSPYKQRGFNSTTSLVGNDISSVHPGNSTEPIQKRESISSRPTASFSHQPQPQPPAAQLRQDSRSIAPVLSLPFTGTSGSSRLPLPKSRFGTSGGSPQPGDYDYDQGLVSSKFNELSPFSASTARLAGSMTMGVSTPNLHSRYQQESDNHLGQLNELQSIANRRTSADLDRMPSSAFGKARQKETVGRGNGNDGALKNYEVLPIDLDSDMDVDHQVSQHLDVAVANMSDVMPSPSRPGDRFGGSQMDQKDSRQHWSPHQHRTSSSTIIQHVQGVERPASAMQRTFSQERELSEANRGLESPRKISRTFYSPPADSLSSSRGPGQVNSPGLSSSNYLQSGRTLQSQSQPQKQHVSSLRQTPTSPSVRSAARRSRQWPTGTIGLGLDDQAAGGISKPDDDTPEFVHLPSFTPIQHSKQHEVSSRLTSSKPKHSIGAGNIEADEARLGGMASSSTPLNDTPMTDAGSSIEEDSQQSQQNKANSIEDPYRYQITSPTQLRAPRAKLQSQVVQQNSQLSTHSPKTGSSSSFSSSQSFTRDQNQDSHYSQNSQKQGDNSSNGDSTFQDRFKSHRSGSGNIELSTSEVEESSIDQSQSKEVFEAKRQMQIEMRRKLQGGSRLRPSSQPQQDQDRATDSERRVQYKQYESPESATPVSTANTNNLKQSNETTMAGLSSGGNSDEQDHLEVPSTSCVTTTSMSLSMHRDHPQLQKQHDIQVRPKSRSENTQKQDHYALDMLDEMHLEPGGVCEEVEKHLRSMIRARREGVLPLTSLAAPPPRPPSVFLTRWINYERYGVGWHLTNGVNGVMCNDKSTIIMSPNGVDLEVIELPHKHRAGIRKSRRKDAPDVISGRSKNTNAYSHGIVQDSVLSSRSPSKQTLAESMSELRAVLDLERENDDDGEYQMMHIYDKEDNIVRPMPVSRGDSMAPSNGTRHSTLGDPSEWQTKERKKHSPIQIEPEDEFLDHCDRFDNVKFLATLERTHCKANKYPKRYEKKIKVLSSFKNYMIQMLSELSWAYTDQRLTHNLPYLTDWFRRKHVLSRLSNGIVQVNFADHTKMVLSEHGQVLTFIDHDENPRRITMTVHQALTPEYFYDVEDVTDQDTLIQAELDMIARQHVRPFGRPPTRTNSGYVDNRPKFNPAKDYDLIIFPRPRLIKKEFERPQQPSSQQSDQSPSVRSTSITPSRDHCNSAWGSSPSYPLIAGKDASQVPLEDLNKEGDRITICSMTFMELHFELVRRLRLAHNLLIERKEFQIEEHKKEQIEREQLMKDREDNKRRRRERQAQKEKRERAGEDAESKQIKETDDVEIDDYEEREQDHQFDFSDEIF